MDGILLKRVDERVPAATELIVDVERTGHMPPLSPADFSAYLHRPAQLRDEVAAGGFEVIDLVSVEGPAYLLNDLDARLADDDGRRVVMETARALERVPELLGIGPHLLATGRQ